MISVVFHLLGDLATLADLGSQTERSRNLPEPASVKDALEGLGIPHTEVDLLLIRDHPVPFSYRVRDGDHIVVHPVPPSGAADLAWPDNRLQPRPLAFERFACDQHLGKLARLLRILGFDTAYDRHWREVDIACLSDLESRAVLTCNRALLKRKVIARGRLVRARQPDAQVAEVMCRFGLASTAQMFGRCCVCNGELAEVPKAAVLSRIPPGTRQWRNEYFLCQQCDRLYWEGTHVAALRHRLSAIRESC